MLVLGAVAAMGAAALDMYGLALPYVAADLGVSPARAQLTLTVVFLGLGLGQVLAGPLSDVFGRRRPLLAGIALYTAAGIVCGLATSVEVLIAGRFLQGVAAAAGVVISRAMIKDIYTGPDVARHYSRLFLVMGATPILAPLIGARLVDLATWRWIFVVLCLFGGLLLAAAGLRLPETLAPERRRPGGIRETLATFGMLLRHRTFVGYALVFALGTAAIVSLVSVAPFALEDFGRGTDTYSILFLSGAFTLMLVTNLNARLVRTVSSRRLLFAGLFATPLAGAALLAVGGRGFWWFVPSYIAIWAMWGLVPANLTALALRDHARVAGTAAALLGCSQYGLGSLFSPVAGAIGNTPEALGIVILCAGLGALTLTVTTIKGERARARTPVARPALAESQTLPAP